MPLPRSTRCPVASLSPCSRCRSHPCRCRPQCRQRQARPAVPPASKTGSDSRRRGGRPSTDRTYEIPYPTEGPEPNSVLDRLPVTSRRVGVLWNDQHRSVGRPDECLGDAAEQVAVEPGPTVGAQQDTVDRCLVGVRPDRRRDR